MKKTIGIIGPIGTFTYKGKVVTGVQLADIIAAVSSTKDLTELIVEYDTPGGSVAVGKSIYNYLKSIQPRVAVTSKQVGDVGSIGTVAWFSGSKRLAAKGTNPETGKPYALMAHMPWVGHTEGDADELQKETDALRLNETEMIDFYAEQTGITKEGITPLMKAEYTFGAERAVELKFATETYDAINQAAYNPMEQKEKDSLVDQLIALFKKKASKKDDAIAAAPPAELMGKPVLVDGKPAVDGVYTVVGGVITALESVEEEAAEDGAAAPAAKPGTAQAADGKKLDAILAAMKEQPNAEVLLSAASKLMDEKLVALKKTIKTTHTPEGFDPAKTADDSKEWDRSFKANEHVAMKKGEPERYQRLFYAKYGKMPNM